jgi:hypothetical protein
MISTVHLSSFPTGSRKPIIDNHLLKYTRLSAFFVIYCPWRSHSSTLGIFDMVRIRHMGSIASVLVVFFLFTPFFTNSFSTSFPLLNVNDFTVTQKNSLPSRSEIELPFEEREKEEERSSEEKFQKCLLFICLISESHTIVKTGTETFNFYQESNSSDEISSTPLYIVTHRLLI